MLLIQSDIVNKWISTKDKNVFLRIVTEELREGREMATGRVGGQGPRAVPCQKCLKRYLEKKTFVNMDR